MSDPVPLDILDSQTTVANSAVVLSEDRSAIVQLDPDHPGFTDKAYRRRRNLIAQAALDHVPGMPPADVLYTEQEHSAWRSIWEELGPAHQRFACAEYQRCSEALSLPRDKIPQLREVSARIEKLSGFRLEPVGGLVHPKVFLSALGNGVFLSTQYIRHHSTPLYTPEPDVVHELVGHAAMLASPVFTGLTRQIGEVARRLHEDDDEQILQLGRIYWFTVEFGVVRQDGQLKAYGAGILSSAGELEAMHQAQLEPLDFDVMRLTDYDVTQYQPRLFCAESFDAMHRQLSSYLQRWVEELD